MVNFMRTAINEQRKYRGLDQISATDFLRLMREKKELVEMDNKLANRSVNEGFSGGEKKRNEIFQIGVCSIRVCLFWMKPTQDSTSMPYALWQTA